MNAHQVTLWIHRVNPWIRCITPWTHYITPWTHRGHTALHRGHTGDFLNLRDRNIKGTKFFSRSTQMRGNLVHGGPWILQNTRGLYCRYINDVLSINNHNLHNYVHLIYPDELEIKDTTEFDKSDSYLDILLSIDSNGRLTTSLYDKRHDFDFAIVKFPFLCSNIPISPAYGVYISQLIRYARSCFAYEDF
jgi:hypothetical protein